VDIQLKDLNESFLREAHIKVGVSEAVRQDKVSSPEEQNKGL